MTQRDPMHQPDDRTPMDADRQNLYRNTDDSTDRRLQEHTQVSATSTPEQRAVMRGEKSADDPQVIRENIERTRAQMSETIDRIQYRLDPSRLRGEAEDAVREATIGRVEDMAYQAKRKAKRAQRGFINKVKENPVPAALIGLGLGWMMMSGNEGDDEYDYDYDRNYGYEYETYGRPARYMGSGAGYDRSSDRYASRYARGEYPRYSGMSEEWRYQGEGEQNPLDEARHRASDMADSARSQVRNVAHSAQDQVEHVRDQIQEGTEEIRHRVEDQADYLRDQSRRQMQRTRQTYNRAMNNNPLMVGALALAAGALIGLSVPSTEIEGEWMGEQSERLRDEAMNKVKSVASEAQDAVKDAADEVEKGKPISDAAKDVANRTQQKAKEENLASSTKG